MTENPQIILSSNFLFSSCDYVGKVIFELKAKIEKNQVKNRFKLSNLVFGMIQVFLIRIFLWSRLSIDFDISEPDFFMPDKVAPCITSANLF